MKKIKRNCFGRWESDFKYEKHIDFSFYLAFPTGIYLSKFNNENRKDIVQNMSKGKLKISFGKLNV